MFHVHGILNTLLSSLAAGASVVCARGFRAPDFFGLLRKNDCTWYSAVPTIHYAVMTYARQSVQQPSPPPLRFVRSSSARLPAALLRDLESVFHAPVIESYGMTEVDQIACNPLPPSVRKPDSVGIPSGPEVRIHDEFGRDVPFHVLGEVVVRGPNVISHYEATEDVNREAFRDGWFRTGDQGYFDADGYLFLTGRIKEVVNRGGEKISPYEVEDVLLTHPAVTAAAVAGAEHAQWGEEVIAAVVADPEAVDEAELIRWCAERLTDHKVPRAIKLVGALPMGPTGKIQRVGMARKLGFFAQTQPREQSDARLENFIMDAWKRVLNIRTVDPDAEFIALGGTSLLAAELYQELGKGFRRSLPVEVLVQARSVREMTSELTRRGWSAPSA